MLKNLLNKTTFTNKYQNLINQINSLENNIELLTDNELRNKTKTLQKQYSVERDVTSLIAEAFAFGTEAITTNADTHSTTIADGATDPGRSIFLKYTGTLDSACTIALGPNTVSKLWFIEHIGGSLYVFGSASLWGDHF